MEADSGRGAVELPVGATVPTDDPTAAPAVPVPLSVALPAKESLPRAVAADEAAMAVPIATGAGGRAGASALDNEPTMP